MARKSSLPTAIFIRSTWCARIGRSCGTVASTRIPVSRNATLTDRPTPAARGYRMPAEWEPHRGTWLSWPHKEASWPGNFEPVPGIIPEAIRNLVTGEEVHINVNGDAMEQHARFVLTDTHVPTSNVFFHHNPTDDA